MFKVKLTPAGKKVVKNAFPRHTEVVVNAIEGTKTDTLDDEKLDTLEVYASSAAACVISPETFKCPLAHGKDFIWKDVTT